ncbi:MAG: DUF4349 domain-containing protein, partial [Planctomycetota bacterium]|nr:DUF4349 domain-containing protein [Planctomycetota bacterium]
MKTMTICLTAVLAMGSAGGCGMSQNAFAASPAAWEQARPAGGPVIVDPGGAVKPPAPKASLTKDRKLTYTADLTVIVGDVEFAVQSAVKVAKELGGYLESQNGPRVTLRVPAEAFERAIGQLGGLGSVAGKVIAAADVTDPYADLETRLANAKALASRLRALLARADVKDALQIEQELARVQAEIDRLGGQWQAISARVAHATITVAFQEPPRATGALQINLPFAWLHS